MHSSLCLHLSRWECWQISVHAPLRFSDAAGTKTRPHWRRVLSCRWRPPTVSCRPFSFAPSDSPRPASFVDSAECPSEHTQKKRGPPRAQEQRLPSGCVAT